jgi:signal transduction histidine kinase
VAVADSFPTAPRTPGAVRVIAIAVAVAALGLASRTTVTSAAWVGKVFPGFMLLDNTVIASIGLAHWSGTTVPHLYQSQILAIDGHAVTSTAGAYARVSQMPADRPVRYTLLRDGRLREVTLRTQRFEFRDWVLLFGAYLLNGATYLAAGLVVWVLRPQAPLGQALLGVGAAWSLLMLTAMDLYGPATFFRLHVASEALLPPAVMQLALLFPRPSRFARWRLATLAPAAAILVLYQLFLYRPAMYSLVLYSNMACTGIAGLSFGGRLLYGYVRSPSHLDRQRIRMVTLGAVVGLAVPGAIVLLSAIMGGGYAMNLGAFTPFVFCLALAYAVVKHDLFEIEAMVKRSAYYLLLTCAVATAYLGAVVILDRVLRAGAFTDSAAFPVLFTLAALLLLNPMRNRLQVFVDRFFFHTTYDASKLLSQVGRHLAFALKREQIAALVRDCAAVAFPNTTVRLYVSPGQNEPLREIGGDGSIPATLAAHLNEGRMVTAFDAVEVYPDASTHETVRRDLAALGAELVVPVHVRSQLAGVLAVGPRHSGLFFTAGDAEFLRALAQQAAIALDSARSYEALIDLNERLEARVEERTAQLQAANVELAAAYAELKAAEVHLVQSEKMASLGRLVAGVAHEINNPVSFIATNVAPLRRRIAQAASRAPAAAKAALAEAEELAAIMGRGAARTAAIVKDLRTFSRLGEATRKRTDLGEALETTLRLLVPRWRGRIDIHRDYAPLPLVECDPAQLNQVLMNLLGNACDAIQGNGNIWIETRVVGESVNITIRDDGRGIPAAIRDRIFDPFFTTKDVGNGMGLGLAITQSIVLGHDGAIDIESTEGRGTTCRVTLPIQPPAVPRGSRISA